MRFADYDPAIAAGFVAAEEGFVGECYDDVVGVKTIGFGHTDGVKPGDRITHEDAWNLLVKDLGIHQRYVANDIKVDITPNQFVALLSLVFNIGPGNFRSSTLLILLNQGDMLGAAKQFDVWNKAGRPLKPVKGLTLRRAREREMFEKDIHVGESD